LRWSRLGVGFSDPRPIAALKTKLKRKKGRKDEKKEEKTKKGSKESKERRKYEGVHDEVDPEELNGGQRGTVATHGADERNDDGANVDRDLELHELADVVKDAATPHDRLHNRAEVVVHDNDVGGLTGDLSTSDTHGLEKREVRMIKNDLSK
jgi:hypothetical protein